MSDKIKNGKFVFFVVVVVLKEISISYQGYIYFMRNKVIKCKSYQIKLFN